MSGWRDRAQPVEAAPDAAPAAPAPEASGWRSRASPVQSDPPGARPPGNGVTSTAGGAALRGFGQGLTFGFGDELGAGFQAGLAWATGQDPGEFYREARRANRQQLDADMDQQTAASLAGNVAGSVVSGIATAGVGKGLGVAGQAALQGGAQGLGDSDADLLEGDALGAAVDTGKGAALGVAFQKVGDKLGRLLPGAAQGVREGLEETAATRALKAAGYIQKDLKPIARKDVALVGERGRLLLDEPGVITAGANVQQIAERLEDAKQHYGGLIGAILKRADDTGARFDMEPFLREVEDNIIKPIRLDPAVKSEVRELQGLINGYRRLVRVEGPQTFSQANALKTRLQKTINFGNHFATGGPAENAERFLKEMDGVFLNSVDDQLGGVLGDTQRAIFKDAKLRYGAMTDALDKAKQGVAREVGNGALGIKDYLAGTAAASAAVATGSPAPLLLAGGASLANKVVNERGASTAAVALDRLSTSDVLERVASSNPEALGEFAGVISNAVQRGSLPVVHHVLMQKSEAYRSLVNELTEQAEREQQ